MDNEVITGELSVSLKTRPRNGSYCDYVTEISKHTLKQTRPNRNSSGTQAGKFQASQVKKNPEYRLSRRPVLCRISVKKGVFDQHFIIQGEHKNTP
jgi:hypothetical protein